ncbi:unnamed protein product [Paramecium sonneborni]|uniref:Protein kinase domain-containing protein n=1 Tax=Paramecium sonneborni TaxID=65129 RepID=A0A8S1JVW8_9CILI|nr:unnamed protein product [Paramecium sonneborni]
MNRVLDKYQILRCVGQGKTCFVYEAQTIDQPSMKVAIKECKPIRIDQLNINNPLYQIISKEISFLQQIEKIIQLEKGTQDFQHINRLKDVLQLADKHSVSILLVLEYAKNGCVIQQIFYVIILGSLNKQLKHTYYKLRKVNNIQKWSFENIA